MPTFLLLSTHMIPSCLHLSGSAVLELCCASQCLQILGVVFLRTSMQLRKTPRRGPTLTRLALTHSCENSSWASRFIVCVTISTGSEGSCATFVEKVRLPGISPAKRERNGGSASGLVGRKREYIPRSLPKRPSLSAGLYTEP